MRLTLREIAQASGGELRGEAGTAVQGVSTDSRALPAGALFVAIPGERFDGHEFLDQVAARGAAAALISRPEYAPAKSARGESGRGALPCVIVPDTVHALGQLAHFARERFGGPVIAITGSNGKTTTKELCAEMLARAGVRVRRTPGNLNNHIGLPLSILALEETDQVLVVELGMNHPGEIDALARIASPGVGAITQVAAAHLGPMGSLDAIARAKGELLDHIRPQGCAVLNADDANVASQAPRFAGRHVWFGCAANADYRADRSDAQRFALQTPRGRCEVALALPGPHLVMDGLCAAAAADQTGLLGADPLAAIRATLEAFRGLPGRLSLREAATGLRVLDDSYNANPTSVRAALVTLRNVAASRRSVVLLGDMLELGPDERALHAEIGRAVAESGAHALIGVGPLSADAVAAAKRAGIAFAESASDPATAGRSALALAGPGDVVLVKGSRGSRMEGAVAVLLGAPAPESHA